MKRTTLAAALVALTMGQADAAPIRQLINRYETLNEQCRGGSGADPKTYMACEKRESLAYTLNHAGWCNGKREQPMPDYRWHRCTNASHFNGQQVLD